MGRSADEVGLVRQQFVCIIIVISKPIDILLAAAELILTNNAGIKQYTCTVLWPHAVVGFTSFVVMLLII